MKENAARICVPVCTDLKDLATAISSAAELGDLVEVRLDCLPDDQRKSAYQNLAAQEKPPIILTLRPRHEGGKADLNREDRLQFWSSIQNVDAALMFDVELDLIAEILEKNQKLAAAQLICSHHRLEGEAADVNEIYERVAATSAAVLKIAVHAEDAIDCLPIFKIIERAQTDGRELIAIAMGPAGVMTRILGPSRGSYLTFGSLDPDAATASGQLTARELREVYRIDHIDRQTQIMGIIGSPVSHSLSPRIHNAAFAESDMSAVFIPFEVRDVDAFMRRMVRESSREIDWNVRGFSVTAPHKGAVMKHLDWIEPAAKEIGAINTIVVRDDKLYGYNTDAAAFLKPLSGRVESFQKLNCGVVGAGGAARAVAWKLKDAGASVSLFARNAGKARLIGEDFQIDSYELAKANFEGFDVVVNATPLGTRGAHESETPVLAEQLRGVRFAYDLVYNPLETRFIREAKSAGCETIGGLEMLVAQAGEQFKLWTGTTPNVKTMRAAAERGLGRLS